MDITESNCIKHHLFLADETATIAFAESFSAKVAQFFEEMDAETDRRLLISLEGNLGAGKSFFARSFIQSFLPEQRVKSPTYTLVESYQTPNFKIEHFDLYRMCDPEELFYIGIEDILTPPFVALVEWAEKGESVMPGYDVVLKLESAEAGNAGGKIGRNLEITVYNEAFKIA